MDLESVIVKSLDRIKSSSQDAHLQKEIQKIRTRFRENPVPDQIIHDLQSLQNNYPAFVRRCRQEIALTADQKSVYSETVGTLAALWPETSPEEMADALRERSVRKGSRRWRR